MRLFLSGTDTGANKEAIKELMLRGDTFLWNLMSFWYVRNDFEHACNVRDRSELIMMDSGAFSMQRGAKTDWESYTRAYAEFIRRFDAPNVVGYMEMDIDNVIGYENVLKLREILKRESGHPEKIIPVWHKNRGITDFLEMCRQHSGQTVAVSGFKNEEIKDIQYAMFVNEAHKAGAKIHGLGLARPKILEQVPFDYSDSASWAHSTLYGSVYRQGKVSMAQSSRENRNDLFIASYLEGVKLQKRLYRHWHRLQP